MTSESSQAGHLFHGLLHDLGIDFSSVGLCCFQPGGPSQEADATRHSRRNNRSFSSVPWVEF